MYAEIQSSMRVGKQGQLERDDYDNDGDDADDWGVTGRENSNVLV